MKSGLPWPGGTYLRGGGYLPWQVYPHQGRSLHIGWKVGIPRPPISWKVGIPPIDWKAPSKVSTRGNTRENKTSRLTRAVIYKRKPFSRRPIYPKKLWDQRGLCHITLGTDWVGWVGLSPPTPRPLTE